MGSIRDHVETVFAAAAFAERNEQEEAIQLMKSVERPTTAQKRTGKKASARPKPTARVE